MRQMRTLVKVNQEEKRLWERKITEEVKLIKIQGARDWKKKVKTYEMALTWEKHKIKKG